MPTPAPQWSAITTIPNTAAGMDVYDGGVGIASTWAAFTGTCLPTNQSWHLVANFLEEGGSSPTGLTPEERRRLLFNTTLLDPKNSSNAFHDEIADLSLGDNSGTNQHSQIGPISIPSGTAADTNVNKIYHDPALNQSAKGSTIMRLWYMTNPDHHIDVGAPGAANTMYPLDSFDAPALDVASKTAKVTAPAGSPGLYVIFIPERSHVAPANAAQSFMKYPTNEIETATVQAGTSKTFNLTANAGYYINKAMHHFSNEYGFVDNSVLGTTATDASVCTAWPCVDSTNLLNPFSCSLSFDTRPGTGWGGANDTWHLPRGDTYQNTSAHYYGRYGHYGLSKRFHDIMNPGVLALCPTVAAPFMDPSTTINTAARGDILAVICLDDRPRLMQIMGMPHPDDPNISLANNLEI